jgi:hypothetical protein
MSMDWIWARFSPAIRRGARFAPTLMVGAGHLPTCLPICESRATACVRSGCGEVRTASSPVASTCSSPRTLPCIAWRGNGFEDPAPGNRASDQLQSSQRACAESEGGPSGAGCERVASLPPRLISICQFTPRVMGPAVIPTRYFLTIASSSSRIRAGRVRSARDQIGIAQDREAWRPEGA